MVSVPGGVLPHTVGSLTRVGLLLRCFTEATTVRLDYPGILGLARFGDGPNPMLIGHSQALSG